MYRIDGFDSNPISQHFMALLQAEGSKTPAIAPQATNTVAREATIRLPNGSTELVGRNDPAEVARAREVIRNMSPEAQASLLPAYYRPDTAEPDHLAMYAAQPPANESQSPPLLSPLPYGSGKPEEAGLTREGVTNDSIVGVLPSAPELLEFAKSGIGNVFNEEWRQVVAAYASKNGGLGDSENGYLAFSREHGFVRFRNPRLTPEQNRRLAEMSLVLTAPIEKTPARLSGKDSALNDEDNNRWANEFIGRYDKEVADFLADPSNGISVRDGRTRYKAEIDKESGRVVSYHMKKASRLQGFMQRAVKVLGPVADVASAILAPIATPVAFAIQAAKTAASAIATGGKMIWSQIAGLASTFLPTIGSWVGTSLSGLQTAVGRGLLAIGGEYADTGKVRGSTLANAATSVIAQGVPGSDQFRRGLEQGLRTVGRAIESGRFTVNDALGLAGAIDKMVADGTPAVGNAPADRAAEVKDGLLGTITRELGLGKDTMEVMGSLAKGVLSYVQSGRLPAEAVVPLLSGLLPLVTSDPEDQKMIHETVKALARGLDGKQIDSERLSALAAEYFKDEVKAA